MIEEKWEDLLLDSAPVRAIFGSISPSLKGVEIHEIKLHRDGPIALIRFDLRDFPPMPPKKWTSSGFNRVQMQLMAVGVQKLQIEGLQSNIVIDVCIKKEGGGVCLSADNGDFRVNLIAESLLLDGISAYRDDLLK